MFYKVFVVINYTNIFPQGVKNLRKKGNFGT